MFLYNNSTPKCSNNIQIVSNVRDDRHVCEGFRPTTPGRHKAVVRGWPALHDPLNQAGGYNLGLPITVPCSQGREPKRSIERICSLWLRVVIVGRALTEHGGLYFSIDSSSLLGTSRQDCQRLTGLGFQGVHYFVTI